MKISYKNVLNSSALIVVIVAFILLFVRNYCETNIEGDALWYHIPHALISFGMTDFVPSEYIQTVMDTFPPLGDLAEGLMAFVFQNPKLANLGNLFGLFICLFLLWRIYGSSIRWRWLLLGLLAIPVLVKQATSGYVDLFGAAGVLLAFGSLPALLRRRNRRFGIAMFGFLAGGALATLSRFQTWPIICLLDLYVFYKIGSRTEFKVRTRLILMLLVVAATGIWPARNFIKFGNPTYPYRAPLIGKYFPAAITMEQLRNDQRPVIFADVPNPVLFLMSAFEINRVLHRDVKFRWSVDGRAEGDTANPHFRLGGWSGLNMVLLVLALIWGWRRRAIGGDLIGLIFAMALFVSFLPQGHEMRYFIFIPMCMVFALVVNLSKFSQQAQLVVTTLLLASAIHTLEQTKVQRIEFTSIADTMLDYHTEAWAAYETATEKRPLCGGGKYDSLKFTGPTLSEYPVRDETSCDGYFVKR